jgi:hypothetical protein
LTPNVIAEICPVMSDWFQKSVPLVPAARRAI